MHHNGRHGGEKLDQIIPVRDPIHGVLCGAVESQKFCRVLPVQRIGGPRQGPTSERAVVHALINILQPQTIPPKHLKIGSHVMSQTDGLSLLQVGESRHNGLCVLLHNMKNYLQELAQLRVKLTEIPASKEAHIQSHLVITASSGVQLLACIADAVDQVRLDEGMDVLIAVRDFQDSGRYVALNSVQAL